MVDIEPQRDARTPAMVMFQLPGHVVGHPRAAGQIVAGGGLKVRFDGDAEVVASGVAAAVLSSAVAASALARSIEQALIDAVQSGALPWGSTGLLCRPRAARSWPISRCAGTRLRAASP